MTNVEGEPFTVADDAVVTLRSLASPADDLAFLDGRTLDHSVGLAGTTDPPFTGTQWLMHQEGSANRFSFACLGPARVPGEEDQNLWLCAVAPNSVVLTSSLGDPGRVWTVVDDVNIEVDAAVLLSAEQVVPGRFLRGIPLPLGPAVDLHEGADQTFHQTSWQLGPVTVASGQPPPPHGNQ